MTESMKDDNLHMIGLSAPNHPSKWGVPIYSWLAVSNYSPVKEHWWVRGVAMPYEIVLMPGYQRPESLVMFDIDSIWYEGPLAEPLAIWDGEYSYNLFEMISMCMDPAGEMVDFIKVRDKKTGEFLDDPRPKEMLRNRPQRAYAGAMIDVARNKERAKYVEHVLRRYYEEWREKTKAWCIGTAFSPCYDYKPNGRARKATEHWRLLAGRHPNVADTWLLGNAPNKVQVVPGVKFGLRLFQKEMEKHPDWMPKQLELDHLIETGSNIVATPYQQASFKETRGIPLSAEEVKILSSDGDYATPGARGFLDRFQDLMRRA